MTVIYIYMFVFFLAALLMFNIAKAKEGYTRGLLFTLCIAFVCCAGYILYAALTGHINV